MTNEDRINELQIIFQICMNNGYPRYLVDNIVNKISKTKDNHEQNGSSSQIVVLNSRIIIDYSIKIGVVKYWWNF